MLTLFGKATSHLTTMSNGQRLHSEVIDDFLALQNAAAMQGFSLSIASGFRDFDRQLAIWNGKYTGLRPVFNKLSQEIDIQSMTELEKVEAILTFSALPGASRHHWGTEFDFYDKSAVDSNYQLQLIEDEYIGNGPFRPLTEWLWQNAAAFGFDFPYRVDIGGVAAEPWHLSHKATAKIFLNQIKNDPNILFDLIASEDIEGKHAILSNFDYIYSRYILNQGQLA